MEIHYLDIKEKILLPSERSVLRFPSISAIAALDATLAIAKNAILCDNPSIQELMDILDNDEDEEIPSHLFVAHNIADSIYRLRLIIHTYNKQTGEYLKQIKVKELPF